jgi:hypothetical protein
MEKPKLVFKHKNRESEIKRNPPTTFNNKDSESKSVSDSENEFDEFFMDLTIRKTIHSSKSSLSDPQGNQYCTRFIASSGKNINKNIKQKFFFIVLISEGPFKPVPRARILIKHSKTKAKKKTAQHIMSSRFLIDFKTKKMLGSSDPNRMRILIVDTISNPNDRIFSVPQNANIA